MNKYLIKLADHLDKKGLHKEADYVDWILKNAKVSKIIESAKLFLPFFRIRAVNKLTRQLL